MKNLPLKLPKELTDKFQIENNTLKRDVKQNPKDRIEIEIGDSKQSDFLPQAKIMRWDNETNFSLRFVDNEPGEPVIETEGKVIKYIKPKVEFHAYELDPSELGEDGGLEIELLLKEKPDTNKFDFTLQTKGLDFFYQPALTQQEIDDGSSRPENVVGSYAVYHKTKGGMNRIDGMEYKVGKAFHIYRPKVTDANGVETWGELNIDEQNGLLSVTIDQAWLDTAVYPILVDPTFGYGSVGGTRVVFHEFININNRSLPENGTVTSITSYHDTNNLEGGETADIGHAIYDNAGNLEGNTTASVINNDLAQWVGESLSVSVVAGNYWLGVWVANTADTSSDDIALFMDDTNSHTDSQTFLSNQSPADNSWPDPISTTSTGFLRTYSIYATYTATDTFAIDGTSSKASAAVSSSTHSHVCTGTDRILLVFVGPGDSVSGDRTVSGITYNGDALTKIADSDVGYERVEAWYLVNPDTGNNSIVVTMGGTCSNLSVHAISFVGAKQTGQPDASANPEPAAEDPISESLTTINANCYVVSMVQTVNDGVDSLGGSQTQIASTGSGYVVSSVSGKHVSAGSVTHEYDSGVSDDAAMVLVSVQPAAGGGGGTVIKDLIGGGFILFPR